MKILVERRDGTKARISLVPPLDIRYGKAMHTLSSADGMDYFFNDDGTYDGWGTGGVVGMEPAQIEDRIREIEEDQQR